MSWAETPRLTTKPLIMKFGWSSLTSTVRVVHYTRGRQLSGTSEARLVPDVEDIALARFFVAYLKFLRGAGHHVLFGLPDFTDQKVLETLPVDYSRLPKMNIDNPSTTLTLEEFSTFCTGITYFNITVEQINTFLNVNQYQRADIRAQEKRDVLAASISSIRWSHAETTYEINFEAPSIMALCLHELLFIFKVKNVRVENQYVHISFLM